MRSGSMKRILSILALAAAVVAAGAVWPRGLALIASDADGKTLFSHPVGIGDSFTIHFLHSAMKSPVGEIFSVTGPDEFTLRETVYQDFGFGLPHEELEGRKMAFADGKIRLSGYAVKFTDLRLRVGHIADHALLFDNGAVVVKLADYQRRGGEVRLRVGKVRGWW